MALSEADEASWVEVRWDCVLDRADSADEINTARDALADAARDGRWADVFATLDATTKFPDLTTVNSTRVGGSSGFAPLHQAAWHDAAPIVVDELLRRGAWRTLRNAAGETAADVARRRGHHRLADRLIVDRSPQRRTLLSDLETYLAALITVRTRVLGRSWRMPQLGPLDGIPEARCWAPIPGMYGGFSYRWLDHDGGVLEVTSWSRVVGGSGQIHHLSDNGVVLIEDGLY